MPDFNDRELMQTWADDRQATEWTMQAMAREQARAVGLATFARMLYMTLLVAGEDGSESPFTANEALELTKAAMARGA